VGGDVVMTDEVLQKTLKEVSDGLAELANTGKPLTREQKKYRRKLVMRQYILTQIKVAKEKKHKDTEIFHTTIYEMLISWGERHPVLMFCMTNIMRARWGISGPHRI
tara:strand:+ start:225 stop:545 length:321 start_codon:yes stop_codon:yes gene_type:complete